MTTFEEVKNQLEVARREYEEAKGKLEEFMKEENSRNFKEIWGMDELKEEKARLVKEKEVRWALYEEMLRGGKDHPQLWNDASSVYNFMKKFTSTHIRNRLVKTYGKDFEFYGRDDAIDTLWNGNKTTGQKGIVGRFKHRNDNDKRLHPIPVLASGPGSGKSRFLDEIEELLMCKANNSNNESIHNAFGNTVFINTTYGNGSPPRDVDVTIGADASISLRILFEYFRPSSPEFGELTFPSFLSYCQSKNSPTSSLSLLSLDTTLQVIYMDKMMKGDNLLVIVLGIDEFSNLHDLSMSVCKSLIKSIGGSMCSSPKNTFFVPILSGTIEGPLEKYIHGSAHKPLRLPLHLLGERDVIEIGKKLKLFDDEYINLNPYFQVSISDIGGHVRTLEYFYEAFAHELKHNELHDVIIDKIMRKVKHKIMEDYNIANYSNFLAVALSKAILGLPVKKQDKIEGLGESYQDLSSMGLLNLVFAEDKSNDENESNNNYYIRLPYIWVSVLVEESNKYAFRYWQNMLQQDKKMEWQKFEKFNAKFLALRLSLFKLAGYEIIKLKDFLKGANISDNFLDVEVVLPEEVKLYNLQHRYPVTKSNEDITAIDDNEVTEGFIKLNILKDDDIDNYTGCIFLNASGAPSDAFGILNIKNHKYEPNESKIVFIHQQTKKTDSEAIKPMEINQDKFNDEHTKVSKAMKKVRNNNCPWVLLFLTNAGTKNLSIKHKSNSALVSMENFQEFYGYTYASRAQFFSGNEKIYINLAPIEALKIIGFNNIQRDLIRNKRKEQPFESADDLKNIIGVDNFKKLKIDCLKKIAYSYKS